MIVAQTEVVRLQLKFYFKLLQLTLARVAVMTSKYEYKKNEDWLDGVEQLRDLSVSDLTLHMPLGLAAGQSGIQSYQH